MTDRNAQAAYRRMLDRIGQQVTFRRVIGQAPNATTFDATVSAVFRAYVPSVAIGAGAHAAQITEGLREFIVLEADLVAQGFPVPLAKNDRVILGFPDAPELFNITEVDYGTRNIAGAIAGKAVGV